MKNLLICLGVLVSLFLSNNSFAQSWRAVVELGDFTDIPICDAVQNGVAQISSTSSDYRTRMILADTLYVNNAFAVEVRMFNNDSIGGITAFDPGVYLEGCSIDAGASFMGAAWAQSFTSIYAGTSGAANLPELVNDFSDWRVVRYVFVDNVFYAFIDNQLIYSLPYTGSFAFLYELTVRFKGSGMVDWVKIYDETGTEIWQEDFSDCSNFTPFPDWRAQVSYAISSDTIVCQNEPIRFAANASIPATYAWVGPNGFTSTQPNFTIDNVNPSDTGYYFLTATLENCIELQDSVHLGLVPLELPETAFLGADTTLCPGASLPLGRSFACATYLWQDGSTDSIFVVNAPGIYTLQIDIIGQVFNDTIQVDYFPLPQISLGADTTLCPGEELLLDATWATAATYEWQDGSTAANFTVQSEGIYTATVRDVCDNVTSDTIQVSYFKTLNPVNLGADTTLCPGEILTLNAFDEAAITYRWQDGSTEPIFTADTSGVYSVTLTDNCGNILTDSIDLQYFKILESVNLGADTTLCPGEILNLDVTNPAAISYEWQDGSTNPTYTVENNGIYTIAMQDNCGNTVTDEIEVTYFLVLEALDIGNDTSLCPGTIITLNAADPAAISYQWQDGSTKSELTVRQPGTYTITLGDNCGNSFTDSLLVDYYELITSINLGADTTLCVGETLLLDLTSEAAATYEWQDGSNLSAYLVENPGFYTAIVRDNCGNQATDAVRVRYDDVPMADLGVDTTVCEGIVYRLNATASNATFYRWQDGSTNPVLPVWQTGNYSVTVGNDCGANNYNTQVDFEYCGPCRTGLPSAFSPNNDGANDTFEVFSECIFTKFDLHIFDRWGVQVFASQNPSNQWDGTYNGQLLKSGVYVWLLSYEADDGSTATLSGDCTLVR